MSKNLNNNYSSDSTTNLQIASLSSSVSSLSSSVSTLTTTTLSNYISNDTALSTINSYITSNNTLYVLPLFSSYLTTTLTNSLIASLISTNNTVYIANLLSSTLTSQNLLRDTAISTAISTAKSTFLSAINTYTANQIFSSITTPTINYTGSFNSVQIGVGCNAGVSSVSIGGNGGLTNSSGVCIGSNSLIVNSGVNNSVLGSNAMQTNTTGKSICAFGQGSGANNVSGNYNTYLGAETFCSSTSQYSNSTCIGFGSSITASNQIQLGTSTETVYCNKVSAPNNQILTYASIPSVQSNQVGYQVSNSRTLSAPFLSSDTYLNISLITLPVGIYIINYYFSLYSTTSTVSQLERGFIEYGISSTTTSNNIQNRKSYFSIPTGLSHVFNNSFTYVCSGNTVFFNAFLISSELNGLSATRYYINNANITATRIA